MGKCKHFKVKDFWDFLLEAEIHALSNTWEKWISIIREKYGKTQTLQMYRFLKYFGWSKNPYNSQNMRKVNSHNTGKVWEKSKHSKVLGCSNILGEAEIHTIPKLWEKWIPIVRKNMGKHKHFNVKGLWIFLLEAEIHAILKIWEKWSAIIREKYGKTETF